MNQQQDGFLEEEKTFQAKRAGCLLILGFMVLEAVVVAAGTAYYLKEKEVDKKPEPTKILKHTQLKNEAQAEHIR